jgi:hypothetical protein
VIIGAVAVVAAHAAATTARLPTVPCRDVIGQAKTGHDGGYRVVLGVVSVPPARLTQVVATGSRPWHYWRKAGLVIHAGNAPVTVTVSPAWRTRAAFVWGGSGVVHSLRFAACPSPAGVWNAYAGGFYLRARRACVPLVFMVDRRLQVVRFGIGAACR